MRLIPQSFTKHQRRIGLNGPESGYDSPAWCKDHFELPDRGAGSLAALFYTIVLVRIFQTGTVDAINPGTARHR
jgi:hypothetical protein